MPLWGRDFIGRPNEERKEKKIKWEREQKREGVVRFCSERQQLELLLT